MTSTSTTPQAVVPPNLLEELEPVVAANLDRHLGMAQEWHPHDYVPWSEGRDFAFLGGEDWSPEQSRLAETAKAAMFTNLLTEDNLPVVPPRDRHPLRPRRRLGHLGRPLDGRGEPARHRACATTSWSPAASTRSSSSGPGWTT